MLQSHGVLFGSEVGGFCPAKVVHLLDEGALAEDLEDDISAKI
jgi:hypothetical protein